MQNIMLSILIEILEEMQEQINALQTVCVLSYNIAKKEKQLEKLSRILKEMEQMPDSDELARMENE